MLPYLGAKKQQGSVAAHIDNDGKVSSQAPDMGLHSAAEDILKAIESKDSKALASAIKAAFEICDAEPHEEGEHI